MTAARDAGRSGAGPGEDRVRPDRPPPSRPAVIELAAALVIGVAVFRGLAIALSLGGAPGQPPVPPLVVAGEVVLQIVTVATGILVRVGRGWVVAVNVLAVLTFLELIRLPSPLATLFTFVFGLAFVAAFRHKPWFDALGEWRALPPRRRGAAA